MLIGVEFYNSLYKNALLKQYDNDIAKKFVFTTAVYIGCKQSDGSFEVSFNETKSQVEIHFRFLVVAQLMSFQRTRSVSEGAVCDLPR